MVKKDYSVPTSHIIETEVTNIICTSPGLGSGSTGTMYAPGYSHLFDDIDEEENDTQE